MKILVVGSWHPEKAQKYVKEAEELGALLAEKGHTLVASPSSGIQGLVAQSYKNHGGKHFIGYYPDMPLMEEFGEDVLVEPDEKIYTEADYPTRNIVQIKGCDAVIGLTGGRGTLAELITANCDYNRPVGFYKDTSQLIDAYLQIDSSFCGKISYSVDCNEIIKTLESYELE